MPRPRDADRSTPNATPQTSAPPRGARVRRSWQIPLRIVGWLLTLFWAAWWTLSIEANQLFLGWNTRVPAWRFMGADFLHNYLGVRAWLAGQNPYLTDIGDWRGSYGYPPLVLVLYVWAAPLRQEVAMVIWMAVIAIGTTVGGWLAWRNRIALGLTRVPLAFVTGAMLISMPLVFTMERGQGDVICLLMMAATAMLLARPRSLGRDATIGLCMAIATWVKIYPGFAMLGLLALRPPRPFALSVAAALLIGVIPYRATMQSLHVGSQRDRVSFVTEVRDWLTNPGYAPVQLKSYATIGIDSHSLSTYWATFWTRAHADRIARVPGIIGAALVLFPGALWLSARMYRSPNRERLAYPYMLWLSAMGTFWMPVSYDYNLFFLLLAAFVVIEVRESWWAGIVLVATAVWWQPFRLGEWLTADLLMALKLVSLAGIGWSLARRADAVPHDEPAVPVGT